MPIINYSLSQIMLIKSIFILNHSFRNQAPGVMAMQLKLAINHNGTVSIAGDMISFIQNFKTTEEADQMPFSFEVEFEAFFHLSSPLPPHEQEHLIQRVLPPVVFPFPREYLAELTRRSGYPPLILNPSFDSNTDPDSTPVAPFKLN